jgi:hypothetical protein
MMKKVLTLLTCLAIAFSTVLLSSCGIINGLLGGGDVKREKSNEFIRVMNAVFKSADFSVVETTIPNSGSGGGGQKPTGGGETSGNKSPINTSPFGAVVVNAMPQAISAYDEMQDVVENFIGSGGILLHEANNEKAIKGEAMSLASTYAGAVKALMAMYGDNVFKENYSFMDITFKLSENDSVYTIEGVLNRDGEFSSGVIMNFSEDDGEYNFCFAKYGYNGMKGSEISEIDFAYYNSAVGAMRVSMWADGKEVLTDYQNRATAMNIEEIMACSFQLAYYVARKVASCTEEQQQSVLSFAERILKFNNNTASNLQTIKSTATIKDSELNELNRLAKENYYVNPYYYQTNDTFVRDSYVVPESVTVVKKGSIPATKVVYIHKNVTKIESMPFEQPQYLEEIVFEDADNGKLTQIGSFDQTKNGRPTFILSMTKVKNFTLPKTVKKLELGDYVVNTVVEKLDLSNYDPVWYRDKSQFTYTVKESDFNEQMPNYAKEKGRNKAYTNLNICGGTHVPYKEVRYIEELYMPQFNMGITFDTWYEIQLDENGNTVYAFDFITKILQATEIPYSEWIESQNYTFALEMIGKLYINNINTIISEEFLYIDFVEEDKYGKGEEYGREDFPITLYDDERHSDFDHGDGSKPFGDKTMYYTIKEIIVNNSQYVKIVNEEQKAFDKYVHSMDELLTDRVTITKK